MVTKKEVEDGCFGIWTLAFLYHSNHTKPTAESNDIHEDFITANAVFGQITNIGLTEMSSWVGSLLVKAWAKPNIHITSLNSLHIYSASNRLYPSIICNYDIIYRFLWDTIQQWCHRGTAKSRGHTTGLHGSKGYRSGERNDQIWLHPPSHSCVHRRHQ